MLSKRYINDSKATIGLSSIQKGELSIVLNKIESKKYLFEKASCPVCNEDEKLQEISEKDRYGLYFPLKICKTCGLVFASPRLRDTDYEDFYMSGHQKRIYVGAGKPSNSYFNKQVEKGKRIVSFVKDYLPNISSLSVLEVGCAAGGILKAFSLEGSQVKGVDLNQEYVDFGKQVGGLNLSTQNVFDIKDEKYDLIIYSHVLEHLNNPKKHIDHLKSLLNHNGLLYIEVPGIKMSYKMYGDFLRYIQNAHVINFSATTLNNLMNKNGYERLSTLNENVESIWKMNNEESYTLENDFENCLNFLKRNESFPIRQIHFSREKAKIYFRYAKSKVLKSHKYD